MTVCELRSNSAVAAVVIAGTIVFPADYGLAKSACELKVSRFNAANDRYASAFNRQIKLPICSAGWMQLYGDVRNALVEKIKIRNEMAGCGVRGNSAAELSATLIKITRAAQEIRTRCDRINASRNGKADARYCEGRVKVSEYSRTDDNCIVVNNGCGVQFAVKLGITSNSKYDGTFDVGASPLTQCTGTSRYKYIYKGFFRRG